MFKRLRIKSSRHQEFFQLGRDIYSHIHSKDQEGIELIRPLRYRFLLISFCFLFIYMGLAVRLVDVSFDFGKKPTRQKDLGLLPKSIMERADILDRRHVPLAVSLPSVNLYADSREILEPEETAQRIKQILPDLSYGDLVKKLKSKKAFVYLKRNLTPKQQYAINKLGIPGLEFEDGETRVYLHKNLFSHVIGYVDIDLHGISGLEKSFDHLLLQEQKVLVSSLDIAIQSMVHIHLKEALVQYKAKGAIGLVMDVNNGEILAMVSLPDFDPNRRSSFSENEKFNRATVGVYELGSVFKILNTAAALEKGTTKFYDTYDVSKALTFSDHTITDDHPLNRALTVSEILVYSSNIGSARMALAMGKSYQQKFLRKLNMFGKMVFELTEVGSPIYPKQWKDVNTATIAYGHGIAVTPLHLITGVSSLVNGGTYVTPTLLKTNLKNKLGLRVISPETSFMVRQLMRLVVMKGSGKQADVKGYMVGGKTGSARKLENGQYIENKLLTAFMAVFPMDQPRYAVLVVLDEPQVGGYTAAWNAAPTTAKIIKNIAPLLGVMPKMQEL